MDFDFNIFEAATAQDAAMWFRNAGVPLKDQQNLVMLLRAVSGYREQFRGADREKQLKAINTSAEMFQLATGRPYKTVAQEYDKHTQHEGAHSDQMPRRDIQKQNVDQLNMKTADEIMQTTTEMTDPNSFEVVGKPRYATKEQLRRLGECANHALDQTAGGAIALAVDGVGNVMQVMQPDRENDPDFQLDPDWFPQATQDLLDRSSTGERWIEIVNDLARRFAEFFDGDYGAFDFAADAFGRRAWEMGITESEMMADEFDRSGKFALPKETPIYEAEYQGRKVTLNKPTSNTDGKSQMKVYVSDGKNKDGSTKVKKVTFGDPNSRIKKSQPGRRKSFRARHNCDNPGPKTKARYWSCRSW